MDEGGHNRMMLENSRNRPPPKLIVLAMVAFLLSIFGTVGVLYYLGMFSTVSVQRIYTPSYRMAYLEHTGSYREIQKTAERVKTILEQANIVPDAASAEFLDDPSV